MRYAVVYTMRHPGRGWHESYTMDSEANFHAADAVDAAEKFIRWRDRRHFYGHFVGFRVLECSYSGKVCRSEGNCRNCEDAEVTGITSENYDCDNPFEMLAGTA